jgi:tyrosyl-tRNA synthetase
MITRVNLEGDIVKEKKEEDPKIVAEANRQLEILEFGSVEITPRDDFVEMLKVSLKENKPLRIKCGIDPTASDIHLGHTVPFRKMRQFQDLGHIGVVIIGDYTAGIGDPTGKMESRPSLSKEDIQQNVKSYMEQVMTVLDEKRTEVCYQTEWFEEMTLRDVLNWASQTTVAKLLSHETFKDRLEKGQSLSLHELFYPVLQGIDSVYVKADVELGGTDQKFNVLMGRDYQRNADLRPQVAMLLPIIHGTCGSQKMSKSLGNFIGIKDEPFDKFGKVMSIPDKIMLEYYEHVSNSTKKEFLKVKEELESGRLHPNEAKKQLAEKVVSFFHGESVGKEMRGKFEDVFKKKQVPDDIPEFQFERGKDVVSILFDSGLLPSKGEVRRMVKQNAVRFMDGDKVQDPDLTLDDSFAGKIIKVGKRKFLQLL